MSGRSTRQRVDGVLLLDKPVGRSSNAVLQHARHLLNAAKAGHTGTLDPLASGLLPLCFGEATKFAQGLLDARKSYVAAVRFGAATTTGDAEGEVIATAAVAFTRAELERAARAMIGEVAQVPPAFAALKHEGRKYYDYARQGIAIPREPRLVTIERCEILQYGDGVAVLHVTCGKGTYVRVLAEDLARAVGTVAHLAALQRTAAGPFGLEQAITLEALEALAPAARRERLLAVDAALTTLPRVEVTASEAAALVQGRAVAGEPVTGTFRAYGPAERFLGTVEARAGMLHPLRMVAAERDPVPSGL